MKKYPPIIAGILLGLLFVMSAVVVLFNLVKAPPKQAASHAGQQLRGSGVDEAHAFAAVDSQHRRRQGLKPAFGVRGGRARRQRANGWVAHRRDLRAVSKTSSGF